jgi:hypothetical protein
MKLNLKTTGFVEITNEDLFMIISDYLKHNQNVDLKKLQKDEKKMVAIVERNVDEGASLIAKENTKVGRSEDKQNRVKRYMGFYEAVADILNDLKSKKKNFITWDELYDELILMQDNKGNKKFVINGEKIPMTKVKQYLSPSQIKRQPGLKGVNPDKKNGGLKF